MFKGAKDEKHEVKEKLVWKIKFEEGIQEVSGYIHISTAENGINLLASNFFLF